PGVYKDLRLTEATEELKHHPREHMHRALVQQCRCLGRCKDTDLPMGLLWFDRIDNRIALAPPPPSALSKQRVNATTVIEHALSPKRKAQEPFIYLSGCNGSDNPVPTDRFLEAGQSRLEILNGT
ncbi:MAG: hypothetical protein ACKVHP_11815, partial [Verrucomicrobiales bacterium]